MRPVAANCVLASLAFVTCAQAVLLINSTCQPRNRCEFGNLPGYWREDEWPQWQVVDACCRLEDLVGRTLNLPANLSHDQTVRASILIFGDSVERITLHDLCEFAILAVDAVFLSCQTIRSPFCSIIQSTESLEMYLYIYLVPC